MKISIQGLSLHYEIYGEGQPVVCLHGWNESGRVFKSAAYKRLLKGCKLFILDLPGFGESQALSKYDFESLTRIIDGFTSAVGLDSFSMVGQCMGGIIALDYVIRYREKVNRLILIETMIYFPVWMHLLLVRFLNSCVLKLILRRKMGLMLLEVHRAFRKSSRNEKLVKMFKKVDAVHSIKYIRLMKDYSKYNHLMRAKVLGDTPVTIIIAANTFKQVRKTAEDLKHSLSNVCVINIPSKNHFVFLE